MSSRDSKRRSDSHRSPLSTTDGCVVLINSVVVAIGGVYELTGSPTVSVVAGCLAAVLAGLTLRRRC
jgi:hypothetical protein